MERLYPFEPKSLTIGGLRLSYVEAGPATGPVVLLLHGNPTWSFYFRNLITALSGRFRVLAPDHIGCGLSDHPSDIHFRAADRIGHLEQLLSAAGVNEFSLVMHDWGGPIGTGLAVRHPESIVRLVYLNTTLTETDSLPSMIKTAARPLIGKYLTKYSTGFLRMMTSYGAVKPLPKEVCEGYYYPYRSAAQRTAIWDFVRDIPFTPDHPSYSSMLEMADKLPLLADKPTLIFWGLKDPCFHREMLSHVSAHFPSARVIEVPEAGHLVLEDAPDDACAAIGSFLGEIDSVDRNGNNNKTSGSAASPGLYSAFESMAQASPDLEAVITPVFRRSQISYRSIRFGSLLGTVYAYRRGLRELGLRAGHRVLMLVPPGEDFLGLSYAVMGEGAVPVFLDPGMGVENLLRCIHDAQPHAMIASPKAKLLKLLGRKAFRSIKLEVVAADFPLPGSHTLSYLRRFSPKPVPALDLGREETALIAFTSGATGTPKGVIFTAGMLSAQLSLFRQVFGIEAGGKDVPLLPIFSLFSLPCGVATVIPPIDTARPLSVDAGKLLRIIADSGATSSFGSPTLWAKLSEYGLRYRIALPSLRQIFMAGASVPLKVIERVEQVAPSARISTPYGATEALPVTFISSSELKRLSPETAEGGESGTPVGRPVPGMRVKIVRTSAGAIKSIGEAEELSVRQIGEILVQGPNVSPAYLNRPDANRLSKVKDGEVFWHRIGDVGYFGGDGTLYYCGRRVHVVEWGGRTYYSDPVERVFNKHPKVKRSALVDCGGEAAVVIEPRPEHWPLDDRARAGLIEELKSFGESDRTVSELRTFLFKQDFPVDVRHNAKIFRDKLGIWAKEEVERRGASGRSL